MMILTANGVPFTLHVTHTFGRRDVLTGKTVPVKKPVTLVRLHAGRCEESTHVDPQFFQTTGRATAAGVRSPTRKMGRKIAFHRAVEAMFPRVPPTHPEYLARRHTRSQLWESYWKQCPLAQSPQRQAKLFRAARALAKQKAAAITSLTGASPPSAADIRAIQHRLDAILGVYPRL